MTHPTDRAEAMREACLERLRVLMCAWTANAVDPHAETYKAMAAESILREFAPRALPLPATATAVEEARRDVVDKAKAWLARPVAGRGAYKGTAALEESIEALLAAEAEAAATHAAKESRSDDRPAPGQGGV